MGKFPPRVLGIGLLACSGASTLVHRSIYEAARHGPAQFAEFGLALLTFILASAGILLLIHGARLFKPASEDAGGGDLPAQTVFRTRLEEPITPQGRAFDTRHGASMMQARHRIALSRRDRSANMSSRGKLERTSSDWTISPRR
jgi:hypothetical protein